MIEYRAKPAASKPGVSGLGQTSVGQQIALSAPSIAGATIGSLAAAHVGWAAAAIPIVGPVIAGVTLGLMALFARKGPRQKVATTQIVDQVEPLLAKNRDEYLALPVHNTSAQQQAIANFEAGWQYVVEHCGIPEMGDPGQRCISERKRGGRWDWFALYLDPIANDPNVVPDDVLLSATGGAGHSSSASESGNSLLIAGAALILGVLLFGGTSR
jgi:hypothetical protein